MTASLSCGGGTRPAAAMHAALRAAAALLATATAAAAASPSTLTNGAITAALSPSCTLTSVTKIGTHPQAVDEAGWALEVGGVEHSSAALHSSLEISQPSPSELLCTWKAAALTFTVRYSAPPDQNFVQKALNASCSGDCAIGRVTPTTGLTVGEDSSSQFSLDAGGVFVRQNTSSAGLMVVVQNKHMELNHAAGGGGQHFVAFSWSFSTEKHAGFPPDFCI